MVRFSNFIDSNLGPKQNKKMCITRPKFCQLYLYFLIYVDNKLSQEKVLTLDKFLTSIILDVKHARNPWNNQCLFLFTSETFSQL